uniref:Uncharacterized protein n=1 Tax=Takifugu rubripes TaxID=31033 RepID=A0A674NJN8_TAKRU
MAEDHGLGDGDSSVDVAEGLELFFSTVAQHVVLLDGHPVDNDEERNFIQHKHQDLFGNFHLIGVFDKIASYQFV